MSLDALLIFFQSSPEDMFIDFFLRERDGDNDVREKHQSAASHKLCNGGSNPQTFWRAGRCSYQLGHPARAGYTLEPPFLMVCC